MTNSNDKPTSQKFQPWEGSSVFVNQGRHWSSAFIWLSSALFGSAIIFAFTAKIDQTISVRGRLEPSGSVTEVKSPSSGIVRDVLVIDGQNVSEGDPLLTIESKGLSSQLASIQNQLLLLRVANSSLQAIIDSPSLDSLNPLPPIPVVDDPSLSSKLLAARNQTEQLRSQIRQVSVRIASMKQSYELQEKIALDLKPLYESGGLARNNYLLQMNKLQELSASIAAVEGEQSRLLGIVISRQDQNNKQELSLQASLSSLQEQLSYRTLTAPIAGKIFNLTVSAKSVVSTTQPLLKIVPSNNLQAAVNIFDSDIGFVRKGLPASVSIDSFPSGEFGYIRGKLESIGLDALSPSQDIPQRHFPATISLIEQTVESGETPLNLQSGMSVSANIKLRSRPAISLLTDIFTRQFEGIKQFR